MPLLRYLYLQLRYNALLTFVIGGVLIWGLEAVADKCRAVNDPSNSAHPEGGWAQAGLSLRFALAWGFIPGR